MRRWRSLLTVGPSGVGVRAVDLLPGTVRWWPVLASSKPKRLASGCLRRARRLFGEQGYFSTGTNEIVESAGVDARHAVSLFR